MKLFKRAMSLTLALSMVFLMGANAWAAETLYQATRFERQSLVSLTETECRQFLTEIGIEIPEYLADYSMRQVITELANNPHRGDSINTTFVSDFYTEVAQAMEQYYSSEHVESRANVLTQSTLYSWSSDMINYNCYAYALGITDQRFDPGHFCDPDTYFNPNLSISAVANLVLRDLRSLNYNCISSRTSIPTSVSTRATLIAVRKDTTKDFQDIYGNYFNDYHFAKLSGSSWRHKPGKTAILTFNQAPDQFGEWISEGYSGVTGQYFVDSNCTYDSDIVYITYNRNHATTEHWTGNHYHSGSQHYYEFDYICDDCGKVIKTEWTSAPCSGNPCVTPWSLQPGTETE